MNAETEMCNVPTFSQNELPEIAFRKSIVGLESLISGI